MDLDKILNYFINTLSGERAKRVTAKLSQYHRIQASKEFHSALEYFQREFEVSLRLGLPNDVLPILEDPTMSSAIGSVLYGLKSGALPYQKKSSKGILNTFKNWFGKKF